jgi:hypothetical protein
MELRSGRSATAASVGHITVCRPLWRGKSTKPVLRHRFFHKHVPLDAEGRLDHALLEAKQAEWGRDNADFLVRDNVFKQSGRYSEYWMALHTQFRPILEEILRNG